jgi:hypothetical protein
LPEGLDINAPPELIVKLIAARATMILMQHVGRF